MKVQMQPPEYSKQAAKLTAQDLHFINLAENEYANGETVSHDDIDWN